MTTTHKQQPQGGLHALSVEPQPTPEQKEIITDLLFRERWIEVDPRVDYSSRIAQTLLPVLLFFRYVDARWLMAWECLWLTHLAIGYAGARIYRRRYPTPDRPENMSRWCKGRVIYQAFGWCITGLVPLFCFQMPAP